MRSKKYCVNILAADDRMHASPRVVCDQNPDHHPDLPFGRGPASVPEVILAYVATYLSQPA